MDLKVPADLSEPTGENDHLVDRRALAEVLHVMEAHAAESLSVALPDLAGGNRRGHQRHAEVGAAFGGERVRCGGEVIAVGGAMHNNAALDAKKLMPCEQRLLRSVGGGVVAAKGKARAGAEYVHMRVTGAARQLQPWLARHVRPGLRGGWPFGVCHGASSRSGRASAFEGRLVLGKELEPPNQAP